MPLATVLEQSVVVRRAALMRSARRATACALEAQFADRSEAYRHARELGGRRTERSHGPCVAHGLQWWIPSAGLLDPHSLGGRLVEGRLPFKTILATRELAQGTIMLDIGANIGTTSIPRVVLGDFQYVYAVEPEPDNYACLVQNILANDLGGFVLPDRVAIGAADGELTIELGSRTGAHRVVGDGSIGMGPKRVVVPARRLDTWIDSVGIEPAAIAFIKCDVQGWECQVLEGASRTLEERHIVWQFEVSPKHLRKAGSSLSAFCDLVRCKFDCFIDLNGHGPHNRPTSELAAALDDLGSSRRFTDILVYNTSPA